MEFIEHKKVILLKDNSLSNIAFLKANISLLYKTNKTHKQLIYLWFYFWHGYFITYNI